MEKENSQQLDEESSDENIEIDNHCTSNQFDLNNFVLISIDFLCH